MISAPTEVSALVSLAGTLPSFAPGSGLRSHTSTRAV